MSVKQLKRVFASPENLTRRLRVACEMAHLLMPSEKNRSLKDFLTSFRPETLFDPDYDEDQMLTAEEALELWPAQTLDSSEVEVPSEAPELTQQEFDAAGGYNYLRTFTLSLRNLVHKQTFFWYSSITC